MVKKISAISLAYLLLCAGFLSASRLDASDSEIERQEGAFSSPIFFYKALKAAIHSYYNHSEDEESLLAFALEKYPNKKQAQAELDRLFYDDKTTLRLAKILDPAPPRGESVTENWIFSLAIGESDHIFYAIVDRNGLMPTYNYGFN